MRFKKQNSSYVEAEQFIGKNEDELINLIELDYEVQNLGIRKVIYKEQDPFSKGMEDKEIKILTLHAKHKDKETVSILSIPEDYYLVLTKLGLKVVDSEKFLKDYSPTNL